MILGTSPPASDLHTGTLINFLFLLEKGINLFIITFLLPLPDQPGPEFVCFLTLQRELLFVPFLLCFRIEPGSNIFRIVIELERIGDKERFARPEDPLHYHFSTFHVPVNPHLLHHLIRCPGRVDESSLYCFPKQRSPLRIIDKVRVDEPFQKAAGNSGRDPEIDGRTDQDCIGFLYLLDRKSVV
jgi:hypothetical protein